MIPAYAIPLTVCLVGACGFFFACQYRDAHPFSEPGPIEATLGLVGFAAMCLGALVTLGLAVL